MPGSNDDEMIEGQDTPDWASRAKGEAIQSILFRDFDILRSVCSAGISFSDVEISG